MKTKRCQPTKAFEMVTKDGVRDSGRPFDIIKPRRIMPSLSSQRTVLGGFLEGFFFNQLTAASLTLFQPGGQIMPTTLLLAHPDLKT